MDKSQQFNKLNYTSDCILIQGIDVQQEPPDDCQKEFNRKSPTSDASSMSLPFDTKGRETRTSGEETDQRQLPIPSTKILLTEPTPPLGHSTEDKPYAKNIILIERSVLFPYSPTYRTGSCST